MTETTKAGVLVAALGVSKFADSASTAFDLLQRVHLSDVAAVFAILYSATLITEKFINILKPFKRKRNEDS
jgi:hypothetical protein